jgi:hypothetical protein
MSYGTLDELRESVAKEASDISGAREQAWIDVSWPLFVGGPRVVNLTLRRRRWILASGILEGTTIPDLVIHRKHIPLIWFISKDFKPNSRIAYELFRLKHRRCLSDRMKCAEGLGEYISAQFSNPLRETTTKQDADFAPWDVLNRPLDEAVYMIRYGAILGGFDAVINAPLQTLWQMDEVMDGLAVLKIKLLAKKLAQTLFKIGKDDKKSSNSE